MQLLILSLSYLINSIPLYFDNYSIEFENYKNIDIGYFGDSQSEYGFNDKLISNLSGKNVRNLSLSGNTLYNNLLILEKVLSINKKIEVNMCIGNHGVGESYFLTGKDVGIEISKWFPFYNFDEVKYLYENYPIKSLRGFFGLISSLKLKTFGFSEGVTRMKILRETSQGNDAKPYDYDNMNPLWLSKLIKLVEKNSKTKFKVVRIPIHKEIFFENEFYNEIICKLSNLNNLEFQDYQEIELFDEDFRDHNHLSSSGAKKLSIEFFRRNIEINK